MFRIATSYFALLTLVIGLVGCARPFPTVVKPTPELVAKQFEEIVFGPAEANRKLVVMRWTWSVRYHFQTESWGKTGAFPIEVGRVGFNIQGATGITVSVVRHIEDANVSMVIYPQRLFPQVEKKLRGGLGTAKEMPGDKGCFGLLNVDEFDQTIVGAAVAIAVDMPESKRRKCIPLKLFQIMGFPGDGCHYRPSLACKRDLVFRLQPADRLMLAVLYSDELKSGMGRNEAMPLVRSLIEERWEDFIAE